MGSPVHIHIYRLLIITLLIITAGCNPLYVVRAGYEEGKILLNREKISTVITSNSRGSAITTKLRYVLAARNYAKHIQLTPGNSYTRYTHIDRDVLVWVLLASKPDSFELHSWWYPIVGRMPYKGFFDKPDALNAANKLIASGYETWVRGSEAFSTLGWFNDPVLTPTLRNHRVRIVNTVLHETFHRTVWLPDHVSFNESAANFVGLQGAIDFFSAHSASGTTCNATDSYQLTESVCNTYDNEAFLYAMNNLRYELELSDIIAALYDDLSELYESDSSKKEKLVQREVLFAKHIDPLRVRYPQMRALKSINNAEIMQLKLYLTELRAFWKLFLSFNGSWERFITELTRIASATKHSNTLDPFALLYNAIGEPGNYHPSEAKLR